MNDNSFEDCLREIARGSTSHDPTPEWKESILAAAMAPPPRLLPPRFLVLGLAAAWVAIACFHWAGSPTAMAPALVARPVVPPQSLFASHEQLLRQLELP